MQDDISDGALARTVSVGYGSLARVAPAVAGPMAPFLRTTSLHFQCLAFGSFARVAGRMNLPLESSPTRIIVMARLQVKNLSGSVTLLAPDFRLRSGSGEDYPALDLWYPIGAAALHPYWVPSNGAHIPLGGVSELGVTFDVPARMDSFILMAFGRAACEISL